jgi:hypothetical protein
VKFPLLMHRTRGIYGPQFQLAPGGLVHGQGNAYAAGGALAGVKPTNALVLAETEVQVSFTACATVVTVADVQIQIDGGTWVNATAVSGSPGSILVFTVPTIAAGDEVRIRGAAGALTDCGDPAENIDAWEIPVQNTLELPGNFMLLETGGSDTFLLETGGSDAFLLEDSA